MGLLELIRSGGYVADAGARDVPRGGRGSSLAEAAERIAEDGEPLGPVRDFLDQVTRRTDDELAALIRERPKPTGSRRADALLAAVAEHLAAVRRLPCPGWVHEEERFLDRFWFVSDVPGFRAIAIAQSPVALKRRGILWPARSLERV